MNDLFGVGVPLDPSGAASPYLRACIVKVPNGYLVEILNPSEPPKKFTPTPDDVIKIAAAMGRTMLNPEYEKTPDGVGPELTELTRPPRELFVFPTYAEAAAFLEERLA